MDLMDICELKLCKHCVIKEISRSATIAIGFVEELWPKGARSDRTAVGRLEPRAIELALWSQEAIEETENKYL
jgi:hypothetical protein